MDDPTCRAHIGRLNEILNCTSIALQTRHFYNANPYDPSTIGLDVGISTFTSLRGPLHEMSEEGHDEVDGRHSHPITLAYN